MDLRSALAMAIGAVVATATPLLRADAATLEVPGDHATIQEALDAAADGDVVLVAPGTWAGPLSLAGKTVTLASHFIVSGDPALIDQTVIDGGGGSHAIFVDDSVGPATTIQGLTIRNADDGIRVDGSFRLLDCRITDTVDGVDYVGGGGLVQRCVFEGNSDDGIDLDDDVAIVIEDNEIVDNGGSPSQDGDGIEIRLQNYQGPEIQVVIRNNRIDGNTSDGIQLIDYGVTTNRLIRIEGNTFVGNRLAAIGMMCCTDSDENFEGAEVAERVLVEGNTFVGNQYGIVGGDDVVVLNNIFVATTELALKRLRGDSIAAYNLFWGNGTDWSDAIVDVGSTLSVEPLLAPDHSLLPGSPALDAGTAFFQHLGEVVLDLPPSAYVGSAPDLGAFEEGGGAPANAAPFVDAGPDRVLPSGVPAALDGSVLDDGRPAGSLVIGWSVVSGPGPVGFDDASAEDVVASFGADGTYVLRLAADDSDLVSVDDVVIQVIPGVGIFEESIASGADDAEETLASGAVDLGGAALHLALEAGTLEPQQVGLRWEALPILPEGEIHAAWVEFEAAATALGPADLQIRGEPAGGAAPFGAGVGDLSARASTSASVTWHVDDWLAGGAGLAQQTPDLSAIVQEVVDAPAWQEGDALALHFTGSGVRSATGFEADPDGAALLHVVYGPPVQNQAPQVDAGPDQLIGLGQSAQLAGEVGDDGLPEGQPLSYLWSVESGPPGASVDPATDLATQAHFSAPGAYVLRLTVDDGELASFDELAVTVVVNQVPQVDVGPDQELVLPAAASLTASVADDGYVGPLTLLWTLESGPGGAAFTSASAASTQAQFSAPGVYVLRLSADDGHLSGFDELVVSVLQNQPPQVDAGPDQSLLLPAAADLAGSAADDGLPAGQLDLLWSAASGPGPVSFQPADAAVSQAQFSVPGIYVLRLTADDGALSGFDELTLTVDENQPPSVDAGPDRSILIGDSASLAGSAADDGYPSGQLDLLWTLESGPGGASFTTTTQAASEASFSAPGLYVLRLAAHDGELGAFDEMRVAVAVEDPGFLERQVLESNDDAEQELHNGNINRDSTVLDIAQRVSPPRDHIVGLRFPDFAVPAGATILQAVLQFQVADRDSGAADLELRAQASDDAEPFSDDTDDLSDRQTTAASVAWSPPDWTVKGAAGPDQAVDASGPIQEVVNRPGWSAGNALALLIGGTGYRRAESWDGDPSAAARLHVDYEAAACADGLDNDGDGAVDFPQDPGCASAASDVENPACDDGLDNDGDGAIDSPGDDACSDPSIDVELTDGDGDGVFDVADNCSERVNPA
ncbi:MAG: right-handed parallel beta-helix repeat-containing protein, partial [Thermoanaerobaculia bacterium]|nr:right-handed parallel beta-helix repeat-containing protein [Thermoanaerobaculia bacterium]